MRVKEWVDGALILDGNIKQGTKEAFDEQRYVEAFALVQAQIDWWMTNMCQRHQAEIKGGNPEEIYSKRIYRFREARKYLLDNGVIDQKESGELVEFYQLRNKIIHRLLMHSFQPNDKRNKVTKEAAAAGFEKGMALVSLLEEKTSSNVFELGLDPIQGKRPRWTTHVTVSTPKGRAGKRTRIGSIKVPPGGES